MPFFLNHFALLVGSLSPLKVLQSPSGLDCKALFLYFVFNQICYALDMTHYLLMYYAGEGKLPLTSSLARLANKAD